MSENITVGIWAEHSVSAGDRCWEEETIERESDDVMVFFSTRDGLLELAATWEKNAETAEAGSDLFQRRVAKTLRAAAE